MATEKKTIHEQRMITFTDLGEYEKDGWKLDYKTGEVSAYIKRTREVDVEAVPSRVEAIDMQIKSLEAERAAAVLEEKAKEKADKAEEKAEKAEEKAKEKAEKEAE